MDGLSERQATIWFMLYQLGSSFLVLPSVLASAAMQDAWLAVPAALALQMLFLPLCLAVARRTGDKTFMAYLDDLWGKKTGRIAIGLFSLACPFLILTMTLRNLGDFISTSLMPETPTDALYLLMMGAVVYINRAGVAVCGRTGEILSFFAVSLLSIIFVSLVPSMKADNLLPVFEYGWRPIASGAVPLLAFPYLESVLFLFFLPRLRYSHWKRAVYASLAISGGIFLLLTLFTIAVLGETIVANVSFPSYFVVRTISVGDFYERFEVLITILWFITIFMRLSLLMHVSSAGLAHAFQLKSPQALLIPLSLIGLLVANFIWPNVSYLREIFNIWPIYALLFGAAFPFVVWLTGCFVRRTRGVS
ncbi:MULTISPECIES: GerAB/ArcD/ProY family transporter [Cohnella]|uniref:Spore germination protein KB n=1 Tax=Cohnella phaseoli TaxID=456490 RepID=A0A3D9IE37_9BACL|nr:endospore germination permease [Cohnella phaseoli]RED59456.1 spore germination protein KB [Cohnella phaseoli]